MKRFWKLQDIKGKPFISFDGNVDKYELTFPYIHDFRKYFIWHNRQQPKKVDFIIFQNTLNKLLTSAKPTL